MSFTQNFSFNILDFFFATVVTKQLINYSNIVSNHLRVILIN